MKRFIALIIVLFMSIPMSGCLNRNSLKLFESESTIVETEYSIEEIKQMITPDGGGIDNISEDDCTEQALNAYNALLTHVETVVGSDDYYIYDFYYVNFDMSPKSYVIKIVLKDCYTEYEAIKEDNIEKGTIAESNEMIIMLSSDEDAEKVKSQLEPFLMVESWREDLTSEVAEKFPDYHVNINYAYLYYYITDPKTDYPEDKSDYTYFLSEDDFYKTHTINTENGDNNNINLLLPPGTTQKQMDVIFEEMKPLLHKYCVTTVDAYVLADDETMNEILADERFASNTYAFLQDGEFPLQSVYYIEE